MTKKLMIDESHRLPSGIVFTPPRTGMSVMGNAKLTNISMVESCPHTSVESEYIGEGETQHTCRSCGYYSITSNPKYHE